MKFVNEVPKKIITQINKHFGKENYVEKKVQSYHSGKLAIQNQQREHLSKMWDKLKVNNNNTRGR